MKSHQVVSSYFLTKNNWLFNLFSCLLKNLLSFLFMSQRFEGGSQRFEGGKSNLDISLMKSPEMSLETRIAELVSGILRSLEKALDN